MDADGDLYLVDRASGLSGTSSELSGLINNCTYCRCRVREFKEKSERHPEHSPSGGMPKDLGGNMGGRVKSFSWY